MQCSLKLLLAQAWADHKATCDLCHITHRHLFSATQHFLYAFQQENQILRADLRATTYTRFSAAMRNKGKVTGKADFKLKSWPTGEDLSYYTSPESASLKPIITYLPTKKETELSNKAMQTFPGSKEMEPVKLPPCGLHVVIRIA